MEDVVIRPVEGVEGGLCAKCGALKPLSEFKRKLSILQSRAMGYAGNHPIEVVSKNCKACQPATKSLRTMPKRQLAELVSQGVIPKLVADNVLAVRGRTAYAKQRDAALKRHEQTRLEAWGALIKAVNLEIKTVIQQAKFAGYAKDKFRLAYTDLYKEMLVQAREQLKYKRDMTGDQPGIIEDWRQMFSVEEIRELLEVWREIPSKSRTKMRMGHLISAEWRAHCGATNVSDKAWEGRQAHRKRLDLMEANRLAVKARAERAEAERPPEEQVDLADDLLSDLGLNK